MSKLSGYLNPSEAKLRAKGVTSVKSRVVNLNELSKDINVEDLKEEIIRVFGEEYGKPVEYEFTDAEKIRIGEIYQERRQRPDLVICCYWMAFFAPCFATIESIAKRKYSGV